MLLDEDKITYTDEQLLETFKRFNQVHASTLKIFKAIGEKNGGTATYELQSEGVGDYVLAKIIAALLLSGLIRREENRTEKRCSLTSDGKRLYELLKQNNI